jgi:hypothetical protein
MSTIDSELSLLKQRLAALEEQKRIEAEKDAEKKANPMKVLETIIEDKKKRPNYLAGASRGPHGRPNNPNIHLGTEDREWVIDQNDKVEFLEPIFNMLKKMEERLNTTIEKQYYNQDIWSEPKSNVVDEIHKDLYMKLSKQEEEIAALNKLCQTFKEQAVESSSLNGDIGSKIIRFEGEIGAEIISLKGDINAKIIGLEGDIGAEIISLKSEIASLKRDAASAAACAVVEKEEMKCLIAEDKEWDAGWEEVEQIVKAALVPLEERLKSLNEATYRTDYNTSFKRVHEEIISSKRDAAQAAALILAERAEVISLKKEIAEMKRELAHTKITMSSKSSSDDNALKEVFGSFCLCLSDNSFEPVRYVGLATYRVLYPNEWRTAQAEAVKHGHGDRLVGIKSFIKHSGKRILWNGSEQ